MTIDLKRSKQILAQKITAELGLEYAACTGQKPTASSSVTRDQFALILHRLGYLTQHFNNLERDLFEEAWSLLQLDDSIQLTNVNTFLRVIEKIYILQGSGGSSDQQFGSKRQFGGLDAAGVFTLSKEAELA